MIRLVLEAADFYDIFPADANAEAFLLDSAAFAFGAKIFAEKFAERLKKMLHWRISPR